MVGREIAKLLRRLGRRRAGPLGAHRRWHSSGFPPSAGSRARRNQACLRLESQLAAIDRGGASSIPARAEQIKRYEDAAAKQQAELDRLSQQSRRIGCQGGGFFALFSGQSPQCGPLNNQIQHIRSNLDRDLIEMQRLQGNSGEREAQRRAMLIALGQNDCGPQYRQYAHGGGVGGFFEKLFGGNLGGVLGRLGRGGTYRTLCVRTCDGYYFPISYSTVPNQFAHDERLCQRLCPATEAVLFSHRNPGEDVSRAVSGGGRLYSDLPTAFSYRKQFNAGLQLPAARTILGRGPAAGRRSDHRARRYRGDRGARQAAVAAARRRRARPVEPRAPDAGRPAAAKGHT